MFREVQINDGPGVRANAIETFRKKVDEAATGTTSAYRSSKLDKDALSPGDVLTSASNL
jgi:hypothetical protein